jgi:UDP-2-acetamido-3-amino-2,3-dideoxy-glucuronate N-acetyltransferase
MEGVYIHESAHVSAGATIGSGTKIWINSQVREKAVIGKDCVIGKDTYIDTEVRIGDRVKVQNGVSLYHGVVLEDDVFIGPNATFTNDHVPRAFNAEWKVSGTLVRKGASIGANATIICGHSIGEFALVGAGSVVTKDVQAHALVVGNPARVIGFVCRCGERLDEAGRCPSCGESFETGKAPA